jgi:hypothetical protein
MKTKQHSLLNNSEHLDSLDFDSSDDESAKFRLQSYESKNSKVT